MKSFFKIPHGFPFHPNVILIAHQLQRPRGDVLALFVTLFDYAGRNTPRGSIAGMTAEMLAAIIDGDTSDCARFLTALEKNKLISDTGFLASWKKTQAITATERAREYRAKQKAIRLSMADRKISTPRLNKLTPAQKLRRQSYTDTADPFAE